VFLASANPSGETVEQPASENLFVFLRAKTATAFSAS